MSLSSEGTPRLVAFEQLVAEYGDRVYAIALRLTGSPTDAEDVMQDALLRAFRGWTAFRGEANPSTWLYRITVNAAAERARTRQREPEFSEPTEDQDVPDWSSDVAQIVAQQELRREIDAAIARLPMDLRIVLVLRDIEGQSTAETMAILDMSEGKVKARLHRARVILRHELGRLLGREP
jgi:RNA polymerase sigma-70 factor (ECF subfamily)